MKYWMTFKETLWLWLFRTAISMFLWTLIDLVYSGNKATGGNLQILSVSYAGEFGTLADRSFLVNACVGTVFTFGIFWFAFRRLKAMGNSGLGTKGLIMLLDDLGSAFLVFAVITFIHQYLHVLLHTPQEADFKLPLWCWLIAGALYFLVRFWEEHGKHGGGKKGCCCDADKNREHGVTVNKTVETHNQSPDK